MSMFANPGSKLELMILCFPISSFPNFSDSAASATELGAPLSLVFGPELES